MTYEEAAMLVAERRGIARDKLILCRERGIRSCAPGTDCAAVRELMTLSMPLPLAPLADADGPGEEDGPWAAGYAERVQPLAAPYEATPQPADPYFEIAKKAFLDGENVLQEADRLVNGDRGKDYGHPLDDYTRTAAMVSGMLAHKLTRPITAEEMILVMCLVKISRQINAPKRDNMTDLAGYALCEQKTIEERERRAGLNSAA